ncbi:lichenan operon transcriptional antiterminator [Neobacillus niacini]|uniref:BglG family transcription antiterminator n=1 Tax=Neobacillus niacini TaxID=86668 RepID=UPI00277FD325|nr:BglG family transcription antiterminator [Neobacillus niacini]MDQ1000644.1 lichenan operon transcriptional antiterminator [Neobacillus niacini]
MDNFHPRQRTIIKMLYEKKAVMKGGELAAELGVSDRTVRNDIAYINSVVNMDLIVSQNKKGYQLSDYVKAREIVANDGEGIPVLPEERINYILKHLLFRNRELDLYELSEMLLVSDATIELDLKEIKKLISENNRDLSLSRKAASISLAGSEKDKRALFSELLFKETNRNFFNIFKYERYFHHLDLGLIQRKLMQAVENYRIHLNEMAVVNLVIHIAITIDRIKSENILDMEVELDKVLGMREYKMAEELCGQLEDAFGVKFPRGDIIYISYLILGKSIIKNRYKEKKELEGIIDPQIASLTEALIASINREFGISFIEDDNLFIGLCLHTKRMIERVNSHVLLRNPLLDELKIKYPFIFELAVFVSKEFYKITGLVIKEDEIGFIALHLGAAFDSLNGNQTIKRKIALICPTGYTTSELLKSKLYSVYQDKIEILGTFSFMELDKLQKQEPDLILSTVKFEYEMDIKVIEVSPFLDQKDIEKINQHLYLYGNDIGRSRFLNDVHYFFRKDLFFKGNMFKNEWEVIEYLGNQLSTKGYTPEEYVNLVMEREKISSTSFGNLLAIPHPIVMNAYETVIAVKILQKPMMWGKNKVQLVFMFALKESDRKKLNELYKHIIEIVEKPEGVQYLIKSENYNDFISRILSYDA